MTKWDYPRNAMVAQQRKSIAVIHYLNRMKEKAHTYISIDADRALEKIQHPFMIKSAQQSRDRRNFLRMIKGIYEKSTVNIMLMMKA